MKKSKKREPRERLAPQLDVLIPIKFDQLGTEDDPCFGKLFDPKTSECSRCGDSEICAIATMHNNHIKRGEIEEKQNFKDIEEDKLKSTVDPKEIKSMVRKRILYLIKSAGEIKTEDVVEDINTTYFRNEYTKIKVKKLIIRMSEKDNAKFTINSTYLKWKK